MSSQTTQKTQPWLVPDYPVLKGTDNVGRAAVEGQTYTYPKVVRTLRDDPIANQTHSLLSFMLFKEPRALRNGSVVHGYVKARGNWADEQQATRQASKIIREQDSKYEIRIAPTGAWMPITEEDAFVKEKLDVKTDEGQHALRDDAVKEKEAHQRKLRREIREREDEVKSGDIYDDQTSVKYYSMRRVTELKLMEARDKQYQQIENIKNTLRKTQKELKRLERDYPTHASEWVDVYNVERRKSGVPDYVPSDEQEEEHTNTTFDNLEESDDEEE